ncbi:MAG: hypothetical protein DRP74_05480 [Candidatus Omnitrophota bacterium]|nr:MAG: hypothetical protein DRP74_05480 [Candidatus Omnitrophota bacterium]
MLKDCRILLIHDNEVISRYLYSELSIKEEFLVTTRTNIIAALDTFKQGAFDVVIVKYGMPNFKGKETIKELKDIDPDVIIIVCIENKDPKTIAEVNDLGVYDYINMPINLEKLFFLIKKGVDLRYLLLANHKLIGGLQESNASLKKQNNLLAKRIEESTKNLKRLYEDLRNTYMRTIKVLAQAIEAKDHYTHSHSKNVAKYAVAIAEELHLPTETIQLIREACELHDLGKIGVQDNMLGKATGLTPQEWEEVKKHPTTAIQILKPLPFLNGVIALVEQHHEHYDGSGYPKGLKGEEISLGARIIHLADAYDAMCSSRPYRKTPFFKEEAIAEIKKNSGSQFDPKVVEAFLQVVKKL